MAKKKVDGHEEDQPEEPSKPLPPETSIKVVRELADRLSIIATKRGKSLKSLVEPILREFADREFPKVLAEMQKMV